MRWSIGYATAVACGILTVSSTPASAFLTTPRRRTTALRSSYMGWDNDNFLDSLGKGDDAIRDANAEYDRLKVFGTQGGAGDNDPNDYPTAPALPNNGNPLADEGVGAEVPGASLTEEMKEKMKAAHNEDGSQGGKMFQELLARAEQNRNIASKPQPAPSVNPQAGASSAMDNLTVEQQAELFRTMLSAGAAPPGATPLTPKSTAPQGTGPDGRKVGRNRDADAIVNTADVYFAQLKMDSNIRNRARQSGDYDKANEVFADPAISEVKMHVNPYTEEAKLKEKAMLETAADEMLLPNVFAPEPPVDKSFAGVSYKEKLKQRKSKGSSVEKKTPPSSPPAMEAPPPVKEDTLPTSTPQPMMEAPPAFQAPPKPAFQSSPPPPAAAAVEPQATGSDLRGDVRTLMGLLIKHRGGPGFGAGRLRGAEAERFESMAVSVTEALRKEATPDSSQSMESSAGPMESSSGKAFPPATTERVSSMIACIEGGIQFYKNSPPELKETVILTLREVLQSALNTCNEVVAGNEVANAQAFQQQTASTAVAPETLPPPQFAPETPPPPPQFYDMPPAQQFPPPMDQFSNPVDQFATPLDQVPPPMDQFAPAVDQFAPVGEVPPFADPFQSVPPASPESFASPFESGPPPVAKEPNPLLAKPGDPFRRPSQSSPPVPEPPFDHFQKRSMPAPPVAEESLSFDPFQKPSQSSAFNPFQGATGSAPPAVEPPAPGAGVQEPKTPFKAAGADKPPVSKVDNVAAPPKVEEPAAVVPPPPSSYIGAPADENSQYLNKVYEKLQSVAGDGKMGLKKGLGSDEARKLAQDLDEMKVRIVDELMEGPPELKEEKEAEPPSETKGTASKYQEMLAKAKANKEAKN